MLTAPQLLALLPLGAALGAAVGLLKERTGRRSASRWALRLAPLSLAPFVRR